MEATISEQVEGNAEIALALEAHDQAIVATQGIIVNQALALRDWFRKERKRLQKIAQEESDANTTVGQRKKFIYSPLNLFARGRNGGLEIYWQEVHKGKASGKVGYKYIRRSERGDGYTMRDLFGVARPFEREIVEQAEQRAQELRAMWRELTRMRLCCRVTARVVELSQVGGAPAAIETVAGSTVSLQSQGPIELVPSLVD